MKILNDSRKTSNWFTAIIAGRWVQAKIYNEGSEYGINGGRISKLWISKDVNPANVSGDDYSYDRGLDYNNLTDATILPKVLKALEALPVLK